MKSVYPENLVVHLMVVKIFLIHFSQIEMEIKYMQTKSKNHLLNNFNGHCKNQK